MDTQSSLETQHFSEQLITRAKDGKRALLLQQKPPTNLWSLDGHEEPPEGEQTSPVLGVGPHTHFVPTSHVFCIHLYLSPCRAEQASPALGHN